MYKTRRQQRYEKLRGKGGTLFLAQEAQVLSKVPSYVPYIRAMVRDRLAVVNKLVSKGYSKTRIEEALKMKYEAEGFTKPRGRLDVWAYLRRYEDDWKNKHPEYSSPSQKRRKNFVDFQRKLEGSLNKVQLRKKQA